MKRRDVMHLSGMGVGALLGASVPLLGYAVSPEHLLDPRADAAQKKNWPR